MALTREDIVRAATRLAGERGVASLSMRGVARELGVSPMALYNHVENREDLVGAIAQSFVAYALDGEGDVATHAARFFAGLRRWPYMAGLLREAGAHASGPSVDEMVGRAGTPEARDRLAADWLALAELALGLAEAADAGRAGHIDVDGLYERATRGITSA